MIRPMPTSWQVTLADLSLILFLVTLAGFAARAESGTQAKTRVQEPTIAPSQALYRPIENGQPIAEWLSEQPNDPRATLTIVVHYPFGDSAWAFREAGRLQASSAGAVFPTRIIIEEDSARLVYASLAYDSLRDDDGARIPLRD